jgi:hypothetical protein
VGELWNVIIPFLQQLDKNIKRNLRAAVDWEGRRATGDATGFG